MRDSWNEHEIRTLKNLKARGYTAKVIAHALDRTETAVSTKWKLIRPKKASYAGQVGKQQGWAAGR